MAVREALHFVKLALINRMRTLSLSSKILINVALDLAYGYFVVTSSVWSGDQVEISCNQVLTSLRTLRFLLSLYSEQLVALFFRILSLYGWVRSILYLAFALGFSYVLVAVVLDESALMCMSKAKELFLSRYENTTLIIEENRPFLEQLKPHPLSSGSGSPAYINQIIRYPMEDAQMNCTTYIRGYSRGRPFKDQVEWRHDGVPLKAMGDRYSVVTVFQELPPDDPHVDDVTKRLGLAGYRLESTLSIYLLHVGDFGSYTCHVIDYVDISVAEWKAKTGKKPDLNDKPFRGKHTSANTKQKSSKRQPKCQCTCLPERQYFYQDVHTPIEEFRLIKMAEKHDQIEAPVTSVLFFSTNYLHLSSAEDVQSDYTVNDTSIESLCSDKSRFAVRGCSALQRLLAYFMEDASFLWWFNYLPVHSLSKSEVKGAHLTFGHCLCENSFGPHIMKYTRTYYNRTSERYELFEITHPHILLVRPSQPNSYNVFADIWNYGSMKLLEIAEYSPEITYELSILKDLAVASGIILNTKDAVLIGLGFGGLMVVIYLIDRFLKVVGQMSKVCILEGSMGCLHTAVWKFCSLQDDQAENANLSKTDNFDVFLSYSDSQIESMVVSECIAPLLENRLHLSVFLKHRDIPPNKLELKSVSEAIENSQTFIIFLWKDTVQDPFLERERAIIMETALERASKPGVLVIKLDESQVPAFWRGFPVHSWTSGNLGMEDHQLRLVQWMHTHKAKRQWSAVEAFMVSIPFLFLLVLYLIRGLL